MRKPRNPVARVLKSPVFRLKTVPAKKGKRAYVRIRRLVRPDGDHVLSPIISLPERPNV